jgi:Na+-transporting NADH:ubiquinone oxidoreductase subunit C
MPRESLGHTFKVAFLLCVICSVLVSGAAVILRPAQQVNKDREIQKNILRAAGVLEAGDPSPAELRELSQRVTRKLVALPVTKTDDGEEVVDIDQVRYLESADGDVNPESYDQRKAAKDPKLTIPIPSQQDVAGIKRRELYSFVYLVEKDGLIDQIVLPVYGKGLWSTMYGFVALDADRRTIRGLTFYEHGETPGLGGEIDNPAWKAQWRGKQAINEDYNIVVSVTKPSRAVGVSQVDGISGATITSRGVENLLRYWLGPHAFGPYLEKLPTLENLRPTESAGTR